MIADDEFTMTLEERIKRNDAKNPGIVYLSIEDALERLRLVIDGGKAMVYEKKKEITKQGRFYTLLPLETVNLFYSGQQTGYTNDEGKEKIISVMKLWRDDSRRKTYDGMMYGAPGAAVVPENYLDLWVGLAIKPREGNWDRNRIHLHEVICRGNEELFRFLMNWLAALVQFPGQPGRTALVLTGEEGTGKGYFANTMVGSFFHPEQYLHINGSNELTGTFNDHLSGKVYIFADESTWGGDPRAVNRLKSLITEETVTINKKFHSIESEPSMLHIIIASNDEFAVNITPEDRRFAIFDVTSDYKENSFYFKVLTDEWNESGRAAMLNELLAWKVDQDLLRHPPMTSGKMKTMAHTFSSVQQWWDETLREGSFDIDGSDWPEWVTVSEVQEWYETWHARTLTKSHKPMASTHARAAFFQEFAYPEDDGEFFIARARRFDGAVRKAFQLPTLDVCRDRWLAFLRLSVTWDVYVFDGRPTKIMRQRAADAANERFKAGAVSDTKDVPFKRPPTDEELDRE